ncbi:locomotion-related protein Hikaru genki-like, partial [Diachasma alloeum]|uniref:locomotion-related protein Hikaru genki-like n=1 Tax=Diachasma alloeum TaxID=454923 RepID=UPI0007381592
MRPFRGGGARGASNVKFLHKKLKNMCPLFCSDNVPPTILFGLPRGSAAIEPSGALAVFPGSILHLECLFARRMGNPEWTWNSTFRQHLTGWAIAPSEKDWKYRLSIYYVKNQDSGVYTCSTPKGLTNSIKIHV